jgi:hypothetical protein
MTDIYGASTTLFYYLRHSSHFSEISTGNEGARVPWASLQREPTRYIDPEYLPNQEVFLKQNHHIIKDHANALLRHWTTRQAAGETSLRFKKPAKGARRRKQSDSSDESDDSNKSKSAVSELLKHGVVDSDLFSTVLPWR